MRIIIISILLSLLCAFNVAYSQSNSELNRQMLQLRQDMDDLQRLIYAGKPPPPTNTQDLAPLPQNLLAGNNVLNAPPSVSADDINDINSRLANMQLLYQNQEDQMRQLRGLIEEISYRIGALEEQIQRTNEDNEVRFQQLQQQSANATQIPQPQPSPSPNNLIAGVSNSGTNSDNQSIVVNELPKNQGVLGQLKIDQLNSNNNFTNQLDNDAHNQQPQKSAKEIYSKALETLNQRQYDSAQQQFNDLIKQYPDHQLAGNANYWLGESYYAQKNFSQAAKIFLNTYQGYPEGNKANHALYKLALSLSALGQTQAACTALDEYKDKFANQDPRISGLSDNKYKQLQCGATPPQ